MDEEKLRQAASSSIIVLNEEEIAIVGLFAWTYPPYRFSEIAVFFSHDKSASASTDVVVAATGKNHHFNLGQ